MSVPKSLQFDLVDGQPLGLLHATFQRAAEPVDAVPTPFPSWNRASRDEGGGVGLAKGWHVVIAGATGAGKSLVALNCAAAAIRAGQQVCYISLEMSQTQLVTRLAAIVTGYSVRHLEAGAQFDARIAETVGVEFQGVLDRTQGSIRVNRHPIRDLTDIDLVFGYYTTREKCSVFIVDYLQLAWAGSAKGMLENITEISHAIRARAHEQGVVSIGLSQFNRQTSANRDEKPRVEGLMGGSPLENDADQVLLLDHTSYERQGAGKAQGMALLAKNRHGPQTEIPIEWDYSCLQIRERDVAREREPGEEAA